MDLEEFHVKKGSYFSTTSWRATSLSLRSAHASEQGADLEVAAQDILNREGCLSSQPDGRKQLHLLQLVPNLMISTVQVKIRKQRSPAEQDFSSTRS